MKESSNSVKTVCPNPELEIEVVENGKHTHTIKETLEKPFCCVKACGHLLGVL